MAIKTYTEQLESVQGAIAKIEPNASQSMSYADRENVFLKLEPLYAREKYLRGMVAKENATKKRSRAYRITQL